jgi:uncharacterized protein YbjT (DUF2867 family)
VVDHDYQLAFSRSAKENGASAVVIVSSAGASPASPIFYSRMKGELERDVAALGFSRVRFLRPGPLDGDRKEHRLGEKWALRLFRPLAPVLPAAARPIHAEVVARAARALAVDPTPGVKIAEAAELFSLGA